MALPGITAPPEAPVFLASGHSIGEDSIYGVLELATGHSRTRRKQTQSERIVNVMWHLEPAVMDAVDDWYEDDLQAGARTFAARVMSQDSGALVWWEARWLSYETEMIHKGRGRLTGQLFLVGEASNIPPDTSSLALSVGVALTQGQGRVANNVSLALSIGVALTQPIALAMSIGVALTQPVPGEQRVTEDEQDRITEDGILRETEAL